MTTELIINNQEITISEEAGFDIQSIETSDIETIITVNDVQNKIIVENKETIINLQVGSKGEKGEQGAPAVWGNELFIVDSVIANNNVITLVNIPLVGSLFVFFNGIYLNNIDDYVLVGKTITFDSEHSFVIGEKLATKYQL